MPLARGSSQATVSQNISEMVHAGHPQDQAVAAALRTAREGRAEGGPAYPLAPRSNWWGDANYKQTGGRMEHMSPDAFLSKVRPLKIDETSRENIDDLKDHIRAGRTLDPLQISATGKEDGRHRAHAARELGIPQVPVLRWGNAAGGAVAAAMRAARQDGGPTVTQAKGRPKPFKPVFVHGGRDFDAIDFKHLGSGEPGDIRPLGRGFYGALARNPEELKQAIDLARHYGQRYGGKNAAVHAFHADAPDAHKLAMMGHGVGEWNARTGGGPEMPASGWRKNRAWEAEALPNWPNEGGSGPQKIEMAVHDPSLLTRIGKWPASEDPEKIESDIRQARQPANPENFARGGAIRAALRAAGGKTHFEIAPGRTWDEGQQEQWEALDRHAKANISRRMVDEFLPRWMQATGISGNLKHGHGGFEGSTNPNFTFEPHNPRRLAEAANGLGNLFRQDEMMAAHEHPFPGSSPSGVVRVHLPQGLGPDEIHGVYSHLHKRGLALGHTTDPAAGTMDILAGSNADEARDHASKVDAALGGKYRVDWANTNVAFPKHGVDYGVGPLHPAGAGAPAPQPDDRVQREARSRLQGLIQEAGRQGGAQQGPLSFAYGGRAALARGGVPPPEFGAGSGLPPEDIRASLTKLPIMEAEAPYRVGQRNVGEVGKDLVARGQGFWKRRGMKDGRVDATNATSKHNDALAEALAQETEHALAGRGNAADWYSEKFQEAKRVAALTHPEIMHDSNALSAWAAALAITSQGEKVHRNAELAEEMYQRFKDNGGRFHMDGLPGEDKKKIASTASTPMVANFRKYDDLIERMGHDGAREWLNTPMKGGDLKSQGYPLGSGLTMDADTHGSAIFGPKIGGGFYQNLMGNFDPVTQDLWFMRTFGRLTGTLMDTVKTEKGRQETWARFENALKDLRLNKPPPTSKRGLANAAAKWAAEHERNFAKYRSEYDSGERTKDEIHYAAERVDNMLNGVLEDPDGGRQRQWRAAIVNRARQILQDRGHHITNADLQATIWYPEKDLWRHLGSTAGAAGEEGSNVDYSQAQQKLARDKGFTDDHIRQALGRPLDADEVAPSPQAQPDHPRNALGSPGPAATDHDPGAIQGGGLAGGRVDEAAQAAPALGGFAHGGFAEGGPLLFHSNLHGAHRPHVPHLHVGPIHSHVAGRTDHLPMHVPSGSYVLPADVVSSFGEGNTTAGFKTMRRLFGGTPYGQTGGPYGQGSGPYGEPLQNSRGGIARADGGQVATDAKTAAFNALADAQRDKPERAMLKAQWALAKTDYPSANALGWGLEHVGDLTHRMAEHGGRFGREFVAPKVSRMLGLTTNRVDGERIARIPQLPQLDAYSAEHRKLPVYNDAQHAAREAAVAMGQRDLPTATAHLSRLQAMLDDGSYERVSQQYDPDFERPGRATGGDSRGGRAANGDRGVPIVAAGGEYVLSPEQVRAAGGGDADLGCRVLDEFVKRSRAKHIKTLKGLPGPAKD